jgi:hypothetical protein
MTTLQTAEAAVERLEPEELETFLRWLSEHVSKTFGAIGDTKRLSAYELASQQEHRIREGDVEPFAGAEMSNWPPAAREKAQAIIAAWRAEHGR